jgi:hypothetical protein
MQLTTRATAYLQQQEWRPAARPSTDTLFELFERQGLVPSAAVQAFQRDYAGLVVYAGLEPICFGLLHPQTTRPWFGPSRTTYELEVFPPEPDQPAYHFTCAATGYQEYFTLDEEGHYYEGWKRMATCFDGVIEDLAVFAELQAAGYTQQYAHQLERGPLAPEVWQTELSLEAYPLFPQDLIFWARNETVVARQSPDELRLFAQQALDPSLLRRCDELLHVSA